jgi:hypothetical protein
MMAMVVSHHKKKELSRVRSFTVSERKYNLEVFAVVYELGEDCLVILYGGARPHIGAIGIAQARPSLRDPEVVSATSSVFTYVGHKEDMVAKSMSEELARKIGGHTVVVAGIHWDDLTAADIKTITAIGKTLTEKIIKELSL